MNLQIAYTLSSYEGNGGLDQNFSAVAFDFRNPTKFFGPAGLDRTNQIRFGSTFLVAHNGPRISFIGGFACPSSPTSRWNRTAASRRVKFSARTLRVTARSATC